MLEIVIVRLIRILPCWRGCCEPLDSTHPDTQGCLSELGALDQARNIGVTVQRLRTLEPNDPTATAIAGAGADIIFTADGWDSDLSEVITGRDTIASWWRTQEVSSGLQHHFDEHFRNWATHASSTSHAEGDTWFKLRTASLLAGMAAEHSAWRHTSALLAKHILTFATSESDSDKIAGALTALRRAGDTTAIERAVKRLLDAGPASAARDAATAVNLDDSTRTSLPADLKLLAAAADVLDKDTADGACRWILSNLDDLDGFAERFKPNFSADRAMFETLSSLVLALSDLALRELVERVLSLPRQDDLEWGHDWAAVVHRIPSHAWSPNDRAALSSRDDDQALRHAVTTIVAEADPQRRDGLRARIREGDLAALDAYGDVRDLDTDTINALLTHLECRIEQQMDDLPRGIGQVPGDTPAALVVLINATHPSLARWETFHRLVSLRTPFVFHLRKALVRLRVFHEHIPAEVAESLVDSLRTLMLTGHHSRPAISGLEDVRGEAASALAALRPEAITDTELWDLMEGPTKAQREAAVRIIAARGSDSAFDTLLAMSRDKDPQTRAVVATQLALAASRDEHDGRFSMLLERLLSDQGTLVARRIAASLPHCPQSPVADQLAHVLRNHISATARSHVTKYESAQHQSSSKPCS